MAITLANPKGCAPAAAGASFAHVPPRSSTEEHNRTRRPSRRGRPPAPVWSVSGQCCATSVQKTSLSGR